MKVYKYEVRPPSIIEIKLPEGAEILSVHTINNDAYMWVLLDETKPFTDIRYFYIVPTGSLIKYNIKKFIGTFLIDNGILVFHLFEVEKEEI